ncbi:MAG: hypothetical protein NC911_05640 [Candidatus Omnitrophica bacterium]|nr:hypothetical protein [Candidatus Omnitrophota bacterium]
MDRRIKQWVILGNFVVFSLASGGGLKIQVEGKRVHLLSSRWVVTLESGLITGVENRLTGEIFASPQQGIPPSLPFGLGVQTGAIEEAKRLHSSWGSSDLAQGDTDPTAIFPSQHR